MSKYWAERVAKAQANLTAKNAKEIDKQLNKYYSQAAKKVIADFEGVYEKILLQQAAGKDITPADLYKLDNYWKAQAQLREELNKLGNKQIAALTRAFETNFFEVYYSYKLDGSSAFNTIDKEVVNKVISEIWCADGKSWSQRVWGNTELLAETLNEELIHCVTTGKPSSVLKQVLQDRFAVSFNNADMLARTELAHIQTQAAKKRYEDYGIQQVEILADEDERRCEICGKLHEKRFYIGENIPIPAHPRCRCCIVPVVEN